MKHFELSNALYIESIFLDFEATDPQDLIRKVATEIAGKEEIIDVDRLISDAITREEELPTGLENGIAMPHARCEAVKKLICVFVRLKDGIDFNSPDNTISKLVFFSAIPSTCVDEYLHLTASLIRKLNTKGVTEKLLSSTDADEVKEILGLK